MSDKKFSVLIPFLNEKEEVGKTVKSVRDTAGDKVDIVVVNDCSQDGYDYKADLEPYNVRYYETDHRIGSSAGKQMCVDLCETPYFIILDAHCRFYTENWLDIAIDIMENGEDSDKTVYCCACWYFHNDNDHQSPTHMKAWGGYFDYNIKSILSCGWNCNNFTLNEGNVPFDIPCLLGANYISSKKWWDYIGGYKGLMLYGREEPFISIKSKMAGGCVKAIPSICTGHKTRPNNRQPYPCYCYEIAHNEMVIAYICLPEKFEKLMTVWDSLYSANPAIFTDAQRLFKSHIDELVQLREDFQKIKKVEHSELDKFNAEFQKRIGFNYQRLKKQIEGTYTKYKSDKKISFNMG